jgi:hypothetical protein
MKQAEDEAIRIALGTPSGNSGSYDSERKPDVTAVSTQNSEATPNIIEKPEEEKSQKETTNGNEELETISENASSSEADQPSTEVTQADTTNATAISPVPLVLYAYSESETARPNLEFFIRHALNSAADFVFILNGPTDAAAIIPKSPNIRMVQRDNDCYDLGAYAEVLQKDDLWKRYGKFIMLNASLRGPFIPYWSGDCWMDTYLRKLTEEVKVLTPFPFRLLSSFFPVDPNLTTQSAARRNDSELLANLPRPIHDLGHRFLRPLHTPLPPSTRP